MCSSDKNQNPFDLKAACKDCPFRKDQGYLHPERIAEIMRYMSHDDLLFPCHKTADNDARNAYDEAIENIELELEHLNYHRDVDDLESELHKMHNIDQLRLDLQNAMMNTEKICAGWLILGKKENLILNNFRLRLALMNNNLSMHQFKNENQIFDTLDEAIYTHSINQ